jgi:transketolase
MVVASRFVRKTRDLSESIFAGHNRALIELAEKNPTIVCCYGDFPPGPVGEVLQKQYPDRLIDVGIAEGHLITSAAGLADAGFIPFTHCHSIFAVGRGYNQIRHSVAYDGRNVKVVLCNAGVAWSDIGPSHHAVEDVAALRAVPNLVILSPSDAVSAYKATLAAAAYPGPVIIRLPAVGGSYPTLYTEGLPFEIGKAVCVRDGNALAILATGIMVADALTAAERLEKSGIAARVVDVLTIKPLDRRTILRAAQETGAIVTVEDHNVLGGLGGAVAELIADACPVPVKRVGVADTFGESGKAEEIKAWCGLTPARIAAAARAALKAKRPAAPARRKAARRKAARP